VTAPTWPSRTRVAAYAALAALLCVHVWLSARIVPPATLLTPEPFYTHDFAAHFGRAAIVAAELPRTGRLWVYDPTLMAGYPLGATIFDLDNVGTALLMALLAPLGPAVAFKMVVYLCLMVAPLAAWAAARRLGSPPAEAAAASAVAIVVTAGAVTFRIGMYANFTAGALAPLVVVLADRHLARPRVGSLLLLLGIATAGLYLHVLVGVLVLVPCALLVGLHARHFPRRTLVQASVITVALFLLNAPWLVPFLRFAPAIGWDYQHHFFQTGSLAGVWRALTALAGWPSWLLGLAVLGYATFARRSRSPLAVAYGCWLVLLTVVSLQGSRLPLLSRLEPAHLLTALLLALAPPAGMGATLLARWGLGLLGAPNALAAAAGSLAFLPHLLVTLRAVSPLPPVGAGLPPDGHDFLAWLGAHTDRRARILVEDRLHLERPRRDRDVPDHPYFGSHLPAALPLLIGRETIGGPFAEMPIRPHRADLASARFFGTDLDAWPAPSFAAQLARYNIGWIVCWSSAAARYLDAHPEVVEPVGRRGYFRLFRSRHQPSWFAAGTGRVEAGHNTLAVTEASPGGLVLKYHWYPGFCTDPPLPVGPLDTADLAAPFIAIDNGATRSFTLHPARDWLGRCR
jgi:hypothetical protein